MGLPVCFICKSPVLEIAGQDQILQPYYLNSSSDKALQSGAIGHCHSKCLIESEWGEHWAKTRIEYFQRNLKRKVIEDNERKLYIFNVGSSDGDLAIVQSNGLFHSVDLRNIQRAKETPNAYFIPLLEGWNVDLSDFRPLAQEIKQEIQRSGSYEIKKLLALLGVYKHLVFPQALETGTLFFLDSSAPAVKANKPESKIYEDWVCANAVYKKIVPESVVTALKLSGLLT